MTKATTLLFAVCLLALVVAAYLKVRITPEELRARIEQELPAGSSSERVLRFLDSLKAEHSGVFLSEYDSDFPGRGRMITAAIRGIRKGDLLADGIFMKFKFDDSDRLVTFIVGYGYTGL